MQVGSTPLKREENDFFLGSLVIAVFLHLLVGFLVLVKSFGEGADLPEPVVYSISLEPSQALGGVMQIPKDDKKSPMAPIKNVAAETEEEPEKPIEKPSKVIEEQPVEDAEVSLSEIKATPVPPKPTPEKVKPTAAPAKPTTRPTVSPTKAPPKPKTQGENVDKRLQAAMQRYLGESTDAGGKTFGGAKAGVGKGGGGGVVRPPEFFAYQRMMGARIKEAWRWYDTNAPLITQVAFYIEPDGRIRDVSILKGSGDSSFDESVVRAVMKASPLPPPPVSVYELYFKYVRTTFDPRDYQ
jgi:colicin import membrane protein